MKKMLLLVLVLGVFFPTAILGQNLPTSMIPPGLPSLPSTGGDSDSGSLLSTIPLVKGLKLGKVMLNPNVQIGYQQIGANMSIPIEAGAGTPVGELQIGTVDVALKDFNFWSGTLGLNVVAGPLTLFGSAGGFQPHAFRLSGQVPISLGPLGATPEFSMDASNFQFWTIQAGASYTIGGGYSILGGIMWSHMEVEFDNPQSASGSPNPTLRGDVLMKTGVPFVGIQVMQEGYYRGAILYSPIAWTSGALAFRSSQVPLADLSYSLNQPGKFLAFSAEYFFRLPPPVMLSVWFNSSFVSIKGNSDVEFTTAGPSVFRTKDVTVTNTQYLVGGGFTFGLIF